MSSGSHKKVWWLDEKGHEWESQVYQATNNRGCSYCNKGKVLIGFNDLKTTDKEFFNENNKVLWNFEKNKKENIFPENITRGAHKRVWWICTKCGFEWKAMISNVVRLHKGCPSCKSSKGEEKIQTILKDNTIKFKREYSFKDCFYKRNLRFDFAIFLNESDYSTSTNTNQPICMIEYNGQQHYTSINFGVGETKSEEVFKENLIRDKIKKDYCKKHNIPLLIIDYTEFDNIETILKKKLKELELI